MSKNPRGIKQRLVDFSFILIIIMGLTVYAYGKGRLKINTFTNSPETSTTFPANSLSAPKTYVNKDFFYQFDYSKTTPGCNDQITVSDPWIMNNNTYGLDIYCEEGSNLVQFITERTNENLIDWWYSLLEENKPFFEKYGEKERISFAHQEVEQISYRKNGENEHYDQVEIIFTKNGINYLVVALNYFCSEDKSCWQGDYEKRVLGSFEVLETSASALTPTSAQGQTCGGILGKACPSGFTCQYDESSPDATGTCTKK